MIWINQTVYFSWFTKCFSDSEPCACGPLSPLSHSETLSSSLTVALPPPLSSQEPEFHSSSVVLPGLPSSSLGTSSFTHPSSPTASTRSTGLSSAHFSSVGGAYNGTIPSHTRLTLSQEATGPVMVSLTFFPLLVFLRTFVLGEAIPHQYYKISQWKHCSCSIACPQ